MVDLRPVRIAVGPRTAIAGNPDPVAAVLRSNPDHIRAQVLSCYEQSGNPFMVNAGCEIPAATPAENLLALCEPVPLKAG
jgi:uroporphyrinogen decarboxylase